jgi:hypothetical protein
MPLQELTEEDKRKLGISSTIQEEQTEEQPKEQSRPNLFDAVDGLPLPLSVKTALFADRFFDSLYGSTQASIGDWQKTRAVVQEGRGHDDYSKELLRRADINEQQASEYAYEAKYGEEGLEQFKNLSDPDWWAATIGEVIPGTLPFLAGAATAGGATFAATGNPYAALAGAAVGGGSVVFAQSYGDAYYEYLEKFPDDEAGAERYALKKSGISAIINAASVPAGLLGLSKPILQHYILQAILQGGIGGVDTVTQNLMVKNNIDPTLDVTTGLAKSVIGEAIGEGTIFATAGRLSTPKFNEFQKEFTEEERNANDEKVEALTTAELTALVEAYAEQKGLPFAKNLEDLDANELREIIDANSELELGVLIPGEGRESLRRKLEEAVKAKNQDQVIRDYMIDTVLSNFNPEKVYDEQKAALDNLTDEELDAYILQEFGTPEAYERWATRQGDLAFIPGTTETREEDRAALANASANILLRERQGPAWKLGVNEFRDYVSDIEQTYTIDELRAAVAEAVPEMNVEKSQRMSKSQLANKLAEQQAIVDLQRQVRDRANKTRTIDLTQVSFDEDGNPVPFVLTPQYIDVIRPEGTALRAEMLVEYEDGSTETIGFERQGIEEGMSLAEQTAKRGAELSVFKVGNVEVSPDSPFFGKTIDEVFDGSSIQKFYRNPRLTSLEMPLGTAPQFQGGVVNKFFSEYIRPLMPTGLLIGSRSRQRTGRIRALETKAQNLGLEVEQAIAEAVRRGDVETKEEADKLIMAFLQRTGARIELDAEERKLSEQNLADLERTKIERRDELSEFELNEINDQIEFIEGQLQDIQTTPVAARQLPDSLRKPALKIRRGIDELSNRLLNEIPKESLDPDLRAVVEHNLNTYVTRSYKFFSPNLGWNPKGQMLIESIQNLPFKVAEKVGAKTTTPNRTMTDLYNKAVVSMEYKYRSRMPDYRSDARRELGAVATDEQIENRALEIRKEKAEQAVNEWIDRSLYESATNVSKMAALLKTKKGEKTDIKINQLLTQRGEIPYAVRQLLGEIKEPELIAATSFARMARTIENATFFHEVKRLSELPGEQWFSPTRTPEYPIKIETGDEFNPLEGFWTTKTMAEALSQGNTIGFEDQLLNEFAKYIGIAKGLTQYGIIVLSPGTQMRNLYGAAIMYGFNGHFRGMFGKEGEIQNAMKLVGNDLFGNVQYNPETGEISGNVDEYNSAWSYLQELGIVNTEVRANDALGVFTRVVNNPNLTGINSVVNLLYALGQTGPGKAFDSYVLSLNRGARRAYAASDDFFKILAFLSERRKFKDMVDKIEGSDDLKLRVLRDFAKTLKTKSGITEKVSNYVQDQGTVLRNVTDLDKYIDHVAAYMVRNAMPNYDYVGKFREYFQNLPIGNFIAFPTEIARTTTNSAQLVLRMGTFSPSPEIQARAAAEGVELPSHPFLQRAQERAIGGYIATHGLVAALAKGSQIIFNIDDDETYAANELIAPYQDKDRIIWLGNKKTEVTYKDGKPVPKDTPYLNTNYFFPYEAIGKLYNVIGSTLRETRGKGDPAAIRQAMGQFIAEYTESYFQASISGELALDLLQNQNDDNPLNIKPIWNEDDDLYDQFLDGIAYSFKKAGPGVIKQVNDVIWSLQEDDAQYDRYGKTMPFIRAAAKLMGFSNSEVNPDRSMGFIIGNRINEFEQLTKPQLSREYLSAEKLTKEDVKKDVFDAQRSWFRLQQDLYFELQALRAWNVDEDIYEDALKRFVQRTGAGKDFIDNIEQGIFTAWPVPAKTQENFEAKAEELDLQREWPEDEIEEMYETIEDMEISLTGNAELSRNLEENLGVRDLED